MRHDGRRRQRARGAARVAPLAACGRLAVERRHSAYRKCSTSWSSSSSRATAPSRRRASSTT
eukprot:7014021-Prymnesium_polylepis.1